MGLIYLYTQTYYTRNILLIQKATNRFTGCPDITVVVEIIK
jgi:hypothetical protein